MRVTIRILCSAEVCGTKSGNKFGILWKIRYITCAGYVSLSPTYISRKTHVALRISRKCPRQRHNNGLYAFMQRAVFWVSSFWQIPDCHVERCKTLLLQNIHHVLIVRSILCSVLCVYKIENPLSRASLRRGECGIYHL